MLRPHPSPLPQERELRCALTPTLSPRRGSCAAPSPQPSPPGEGVMCALTPEIRVCP